jgi:hypothetical protein
MSPSSRTLRQTQRRLPATIRRHRVRNPLHGVMQRVERSRRERVVATFAWLGVAALTLMSLGPVACAAFSL